MHDSRVPPCTVSTCNNTGYSNPQHTAQLQQNHQTRALGSDAMTGWCQSISFPTACDTVPQGKTRTASLGGHMTYICPAFAGGRPTWCQSLRLRYRVHQLATTVCNDLLRTTCNTSNLPEAGRNQAETRQHCWQCCRLAEVIPPK